ncbi:MAG: hypothetical protein ACSHX3_09380 [Litorimonas sp.]
MDNVVKWVSWALALFMIMMGVMKLLPISPPIFAIIEANVGLDLINPAGKYLTSLLEIIAGVLLFINRPKGALLSLIIIGGAILAHLTVLGIQTPTGPEMDSAKSPMLFIMAVMSFIVAGWVWWGSRAVQD